jgi:hypothetical protein
MLQSVGSGRCVHARTLGCQTRGPSVTASITTDSSQVSRHDDLCPVVHPCANSRTAGRGRARLCLWLVTAKCLRFRLFVGPLGARRPASSRGSPDRDRPPPLLLPLPVDCNDAKRNMVAWRPRNTCLSGGWSDDAPDLTQARKVWATVRWPAFRGSVHLHGLIRATRAHVQGCWLRQRHRVRSYPSLLCATHLLSQRVIYGGKPATARPCLGHNLRG